MGRKPKRPWGDLLGKPIAYHFKDIAKAEQFEKMLQLKRLYGAADWYDLALKIASELDDALTIVDAAPKGEKAARWRGVEGLQLLDEIEALRESAEAEEGHKVPDEALLREHQELCPRYRKMKFETLKKNYYDAQRHHRKSTKHSAK